MRDQKPRGVPMDEWLLAIGLAEYRREYIVGNRVTSVVVADCVEVAGGHWASARHGAYEILYHDVHGWTSEDLGSHAVGAALALAVLP